MLPNNGPNQISFDTQTPEHFPQITLIPQIISNVSNAQKNDDQLSSSLRNLRNLWMTAGYAEGKG
ncbi:MAG: hypothetical protein ABR556_06960 [Pyrinomonadaceae bacterium]